MDLHFKRIPIEFGKNQLSFIANKPRHCRYLKFMMSRKSVFVILCPILLLLGGCIIVPFPINDRETLATIDQELVVGVTTRESLVNRLGQPDAMYEEGRLWVFADPDFENVLVYIDIAGNGNEQYTGRVMLLISEFDDQGVLSHFQLEQLTLVAGGLRNNCTDSRFCFLVRDEKTLQVYRLATDEEESLALSFADPDQQCEVYIYEPAGFLVLAIELDGEYMGTLGFGPERKSTFFNLQLKPGEHQIDVYRWDDAEPKESQARHMFACRAGERLFFKSKRPLWNGQKPKPLAPVTEANGRNDIKDRRLVIPMSEGPPDASSHKPRSGT